VSTRAWPRARRPGGQTGATVDPRVGRVRPRRPIRWLVAKPT
jgi:hypothetical protein